MKIKTFYGLMGTFVDDLDDRVNGWLDEWKEEVTVLDIKYSSGDKYKSVCIIYEEVSNAND